MNKLLLTITLAASAKRIKARKFIDQDGIKHYEIFSPIFFSSITNFQDNFDVPNDPGEVIIDFKERSRVVDHSDIEALNKVFEWYRKAVKKVHLKHLSEDCKLLLDNAAEIIDVNY